MTQPPPKILRPLRDQILLLPAALDDLVAPEHKVRDVWAYAERLDLAPLYEAIRSRRGHGGAPAFDPRVLLALWLYATVDGVGSARRLATLAKEHVVYRWLSGGLEINYHTLADFRTDHEALLDRLLTASLALLAEDGLVDLDAPATVAHDGTRVRASAGTSSMRRRGTLEEQLRKARVRVEELKRERDNESAPERTSRENAARSRAARERVERLQGALDALSEQEDPDRLRENGRDKDKLRASTTDPEARQQRMANGGMNVAHNIQWSTDVATLAILAVSVAPSGTDTGMLLPAMEAYRRQRGTLPGRVLADQGYFKYGDIGELERAGCEVLVPDLYPGSTNTLKYKGYEEEIAGWRGRMTTEEARTMYRRRGCSVEWTNACVRQRGLVQLTVRGRRKVRTVALWHAVAHNMTRHFALAGGRRRAGTATRGAGLAVKAM